MQQPERCVAPGSPEGGFVFDLPLTPDAEAHIKACSDRLEIEAQRRELLAAYITARGMLREVEARARVDERTGLLLKKPFLDEVESRVAVGRRTNDNKGDLTNWAVMFDMDLMKNLNSTYGHPAVDDVLEVMGKAFTTVTRKGACH